MNIIATSVHIIDYENGKIKFIEPPDQFDKYVRELITHIKQNSIVREFTTTSQHTCHGRVIIDPRRPERN